MKKIIIALVAIALVALTTTTAFAADGDKVCRDEGQGICTEQCSGDGEGRMNRWQHRNRKMSQWEEPAMGAGRASASRYQWGEGAN